MPAAPRPTGVGKSSSIELERTGANTPEFTDYSLMDNGGGASSSSSGTGGGYGNYGTAGNGVEAGNGNAAAAAAVGGRRGSEGPATPPHPGSGGMNGPAAAATGTGTGTGTTPSSSAAASPYRPVNAYPAQQYLQQQHGGQRPPIAPGTPLVPTAAPMPMASPAYTTGTAGAASDRSTAGTYVAPPGALSGLPVHPSQEEDGNGEQQHAPPQAMDQPAHLTQETPFCTTGCFGVFCRWMGTYVILITISAVITAMFVPVLGLLLLSLLPAVTLLSFLETRFRKSVIRMQMVITFAEAVAWMIPIVILENLANYFLIVRPKLPSEGYCALCILSDFLQAFVIAGLFEESVKYLAVRRIVFKDFVVDPRALVVYSCCAAAAFGTVEDVMYNLQFGLGTAIVRAFTSVPLHCATGLIMGTSLADRRFFQQDTERWYKTLLLPVFIHGMYDFLQFLLADGYLAIVGFVLGILIVLLSYVYIRKRVLFLIKSFPEEVDVHQMLLRGDIEAPGVCCCTPTICPTCYF